MYVKLGETENTFVYKIICRKDYQKEGQGQTGHRMKKTTEAGRESGEQRQVDWHTYRLTQVDRHTDTQSNKQTDRQRDTQRLINRQTD